MKNQLLFVFLIISAAVNAQCTSAPFGKYPIGTFTPANTGSNETILNDAWAGEYSLVKVQAQKAYFFSSSVATDFITITTPANVVLAYGTTPVTWINPT